MQIGILDHLERVEDRGFSNHLYLSLTYHHLMFRVAVASPRASELEPGIRRILPDGDADFDARRRG